MEFGSIIQDVLRAKYSGQEYSVGETYESLNWLDTNAPQPTVEQLQIDIAEYKANRNKYDYKQLRSDAMPSVTEQLNMLWRAMDIGELPKAAEFYNTIKAINDQYPPPEE